ncbi:unnamed protein product [Gemmataceae bacterium]|nr:unnamed protein product [Gemmataceae bacterium]VTU02763.1 unnamed protein product [Gemmataceae bacterium]
MNAVCIKCWNPEAVVKMHLDGSGDFECAECEETFSCAEVKDCLKAMQERWGKLMKWVEAYPKD